MNTLRLNADRADDICRSASLLAAGELVAIPTETVYGLAADALQPAAVAKIFTAKGRPQDNPLIVHTETAQGAFSLVTQIPPEAKCLADIFWPGPLTVILPKKAAVPDIVSAGLPTVALRVPSHPAARAVLAAMPAAEFVPALAAPSANTSGAPSPTSAAHVLHDMDGKVAAVLDGGPCAVGVESTVISLVGKPTLLRPGGITLEELRQTIGEVAVSSAVLAQLEANEAAASPGMKYKHYAPQAEITLFSGTRSAYLAYLSAHQGEYDTALFFDGDAVQGSADLFRTLRELDENGMRRAAVLAPEPIGMGLALYNRLLRAAAFRVIRL
ncbi:MAG: threonylcarbamoyl-AMP synthase [Oscillospiraceae bacterium]|jgi:L-threonylcarbamoyladenylate synthase|nr:threonylcarbamoyl-AMP synthase [Oscillospiraceae bacterium]